MAEAAEDDAAAWPDPSAGAAEADAAAEPAAEAEAAEPPRKRKKLSSLIGNRTGACKRFWHTLRNSWSASVSGLWFLEAGNGTLTLQRNVSCMLACQYVRT